MGDDYYNVVTGAGRTGALAEQFWAIVDSPPSPVVSVDHVLSYLVQAPASDPLSWTLLQCLEAGRSRTLFNGEMNPGFPIRERPVDVVGEALLTFFAVNPVIRVRDVHSLEVVVRRPTHSATVSLRLVRALEIYWRALRDEMIGEGLLAGEKIGLDARNEAVLDLVYFRIMDEPRWNSSWGVRKKSDLFVKIPWQKGVVWPTVEIAGQPTDADIRTNLTNALVLLQAIRQLPLIQKRDPFAEDTRHRVMFFNGLTGQTVHYRTLLFQFNYLLYLAGERGIRTIPGFVIDFVSDGLKPTCSQGTYRAFPSRETREKLWQVLERHQTVSRTDQKPAVAVQGPARVVRRTAAGVEVVVQGRHPVAKPVREIVLNRRLPDFNSLASLDGVLGELAATWPRLPDGQIDLALVKRPVNLSLCLKFVDGKCTLERLLSRHRAAYDKPENGARRLTLAYLPDRANTQFYFLWALRSASGLDLQASQVLLPDRIITLHFRDFSSARRMLKSALGILTGQGEKFDAPTVYRYLVVLPDRRSIPLQELVVDFWRKNRGALMKSGDLPTDFPRKVQHARVMPVLQRHLESPVGRPKNNLAHHRFLFLQQLRARQGQLGVMGLLKARPLV